MASSGNRAYFSIASQITAWQGHVMTDWKDYLTASEAVNLAEWEDAARRLRAEAGIYARWRKQVIDRATRRMKKALEESK